MGVCVRVGGRRGIAIAIASAAAEMVLLIEMTAIRCCIHIQIRTCVRFGIRIRKGIRLDAIAVAVAVTGSHSVTVHVHVPLPAAGQAGL